MSDQGWQTVTNKKKIKPIQEQAFDPIIARQKETQAKLEAEKLASKQIKYDGPKDNNQDWNYITLNKQKPIQKLSFPQKTPTLIRENEENGAIKIKKVSKTMAQNVTNARVAKQWSQIQLAHNAAVDTKTIGEIERGGCIYDSNVFNKICKALGVKIERNYDLV
jgi:ribosome-binding protein aMBF1 (putative translation factor)